MEDYCGDDELELYVYSEPRGDTVRIIKKCGVHVIAGKLDSFEESEVETDIMMPSPPLYHLLPHLHCGSITASTPKQWSDYLFAKLSKYNLS
jgi:leucine-rich repeat protein SHOC2